MPSTADGFPRGSGSSGERACFPSLPPSPGKPPPEPRGGPGHPGGEEIGRLVGIAELRRLDENRLRGDAHRKLGSRPVEDHPPLRDQGDGGGGLRRAAVADLPDSENLDLERPQNDADEEAKTTAA